MSEDVRLRTTEKNAIFESVTSHAFDPDEFTWTDERFPERQGNVGVDFIKSVLTHDQTGYFIKFGGFYIIYSPGSRQRVESQPHLQSWAVRLATCKSWFTGLRKEVEAPDLWTSVGQERELANAASSDHTDNDPLNSGEKQLVVESLSQIKATLLSMQQFDQRQAAIVDSQFKYLGESAERVGRKDLLMLTFGSLVTIIVALTLTQEQGNTLLRLAATLLHRLWDSVRLVGGS
jgi:hypothetical protein